MTKEKPSNDRKKELAKVIKDFNKSAGENLINFADSKPTKERISFGIPEVDKFTGGGLVRGIFTVVYGGPAVGKSTLVLQTIASAQKQGLICAYIDLEHSFDAEWAKQFNVNTEELVLIDSVDTAEQAMDAVNQLASKKVIDLFCIDSVQAMSPKGEQEGKGGQEKSLEKETMALLARKLGQFMRICSPKIYKGKAAVLLVGQLRTKGIGSFIVTQGLSGGNALHHWAKMILYMRKGQGADAPTRTVIYKGKGKRGKDKKVTERIGFDSVMKMEKSQVFGSEAEGKEIHKLFYYKTGFMGKPKKNA